MNSPKAKELLKKVVVDIEADVSIESIGEQLSEIRNIALQLDDPLVVKTLRITKEKIEEDESLDFDIELEIPEEDLEEYEEPSNHLSYLLNLIVDSENKYNREEIKWYRTAIWDEMY
jgi:DNA-binding Lrp family transcriptional regulator